MTSLFREGVATASTQPVASVVIALVVAAACGVIHATVGQHAAAEARVLARIDDAGTRAVVVADPTGRARINADSVAQVQALSGVAWAVGLGPVRDVRNSALGAAARRVPARTYYGLLPPEVEVTGRYPAPGQALIGLDALVQLGAELPALGLAGAQFEAAAVGQFVARAPLASLNSVVLIAAPSSEADDGPLRELYILATTVEHVDGLLRSLREVVRSAAPEHLTIAGPRQLLELRAMIGSELSRNARVAMVIVLSVGILLIATTLAGAVAQRRRDFGRRRALGASRSALMVLVLVHSGGGAVVGIAVGTAVGSAFVLHFAGDLPSLKFTIAVGVLALLAALIAAVPPGLFAAMQDPVRILRVP